jgi:hypothetical protein
MDRPGREWQDRSGSYRIGVKGIGRDRREGSGGDGMGSEGIGTKRIGLARQECQLSEGIMSNEDSIKEGVRQVVQEIYDESGEVTASQLVDRCEPVESPGHDGFEWDDEKAATEYRLTQARRWIRVTVVDVEGRKEQLFHVPTEEKREGHYQIARIIVQKPDEFARALEQNQKMFDAMKRNLDLLYKAAELSGRDTEAAIVAQMAKAVAEMGEALQRWH